MQMLSYAVRCKSNVASLQNNELYLAPTTILIEINFLCCIKYKDTVY